MEFNWNDSTIEPDDYNLPVLCQSWNGKLLVFKDTVSYYNGKKETAHSGWSRLKEKYNIKFWVYQKELIKN